MDKARSVGNTNFVLPFSTPFFEFKRRQEAPCPEFCGVLEVLAAIDDAKLLSLWP